MNTKNSFTIGFVIFFAIVFSACSSVQNDKHLDITPILVPILERTNFPTATLPLNEPTTESFTPYPTAALRTPTIDSGAQVKELKALLDNVHQKVQTTGWIHSVTKYSFSPNQQGVEVPPNIHENWQRFDESGVLVEEYGFASSPEGNSMGGWVFNNGERTTIYADGSIDHFNNGAPPVTLETFTYFYSTYLQNGQRLSQDEAEFNGVASLKFSYHFQSAGKEFIESIYFDKSTSQILGYDTYQIQPDDSLKFYRGQTILVFEIDAKPPIERFQQLLEKAK